MWRAPKRRGKLPSPVNGPCHLSYPHSLRTCSDTFKYIGCRLGRTEASLPLPLVVTEPRKIQRLEGRILGHGEDAGNRNFGRYYLLLEGVDAKIHLICYTPELEESRSHGQLSANSFVRFKSSSRMGGPCFG